MSSVALTTSLSVSLGSAVTRVTKTSRNVPPFLREGRMSDGRLERLLSLDRSREQCRSSSFVSHTTFAASNSPDEKTCPRSAASLIPRWPYPQCMGVDHPIWLG